MIGNLYRCNTTHRLYVLTGLGDTLAVLECTCEPYDTVSMGAYHLDTLYTPITMESNET